MNGPRPARPRPGELTLTAPRGRRAPVHLADLDAAGRRDAVAARGLPGYRAQQVARHYFGHLLTDPQEMTDLPKSGRDDLVEALLPKLLDPVRVLRADGGETVKTAWRLFDGALVESVLMRYPKRVTLCVSSQAGCGMNCPFCATGQAGLTRNLSAAEIVDQVVRAAASLRRGEAGEPVEDPRRVSNVVFMGMGEPLANYAALMHAVRTLIAPVPDGLGMSARGITISTVGLVPGIDKLAGEGLAVRLALSMHAPDDELRDELVPVNRRYPVAEAMDAARRYFDRSGRRVSIEYALIRGVNDQVWRAERLASLIRSRGGATWAHVNPIPLNPTPGSRWTASDPADEKAFLETLTGRGITTTLRDTRGRDIDGACGQLAAGE